MDIDELIEEQKKTQKAIKLLQESKTYEELLEKIPEQELDWAEEAWLKADPWDYEKSSREYGMLAAVHIKTAVENFGKAKKYLMMTERFYKTKIDEWGDFKKQCQKERPTSQIWKGMYSNPVCLKFFEDYENDHGIAKSIYREAKGRKKKGE